ncbi:uncharacterized protein PHACADRAFT_196799 [Phanerochaete carnosa HHB-10118-sp]|uniref:Uncharacterized protein n=1 Tax=Phanerochaete carnosa (strain HHB-10118-sp) TaxID=650164 RepID=K5W5H5_PHACS|nr:uncharacterized protein PHACADRAFT_196799 [Phanerochaete carnosa HHB-10118-sp]EKM54370.1 hypothetical protein PHACADRAFT_196799 [Phanerochaete carnosa HHB-10118-sp]
MSYASVAAHNAPPPALQPKPDPSLLTTEPPSQDNIADDAAKLNIVAPDFKQHPETTTSTAGVPIQPPPQPVSGGVPPTSSGSQPSREYRAADAAKRYVHEAEEESLHLWTVAKQYLLRPGVAGGLLGIFNLGLLSWTGYALYMKPSLRRETRFLTSAAAAAVTILGAEGYAAERYRETPAGREEGRRARAEGAGLYRAVRVNLLRPGVLGGLLGLLNTAVLGTVGFFAYKHWDASRWDRRIVSAVSIGLLALWSGEGYVAEQYKTTRH